MIDCAEFDHLLVDYVANEISPDQRAAMDGHAQLCNHCRAHLETYRIMISISAHLPAHALPEGAEGRLMKRIQEMLRDTLNDETRSTNDERMTKHE